MQYLAWYMASSKKDNMSRLGLALADLALSAQPHKLALATVCTFFVVTVALHTVTIQSFYILFANVLVIVLRKQNLRI